MLSPEAAVAVLDGFRTGLTDVADILNDPFLVVDASGDAPAGQIEVPVGFPAVVVAVAGRSAPPLSPRGPDVALTAATDPPPPWVAVADVEEALAALQDRVRAGPGAAVTLVEVLRTGRGRSVEEGLQVESAAYSMLQAGPEFARWLSARGAVPVRTSTEPAVQLFRSESRLEIILNRPEVHNAYSRRMRDDLCDALVAGLAEPGVMVALRGAGPSFCSGGDLDEFGTAPDPVAAHLIRTGRSPGRLLAELGGRAEALIHGSCAGSGIELPAFTGLVRARPGTEMWLPELAMGLVPGAGGTVSIPRRIGAGRTAWMALSGERIGVDTAVRWGLVDSVAED